MFVSTENNNGTKVYIVWFFHDLLSNRVEKNLPYGWGICVSPFNLRFLKGSIQKKKKYVIVNNCIGINEELGEVYF